MKLYNTLSHTLETFTPLQDTAVRIYSCGPTVYDHAHIGNLSAYIFADTLRNVIALTGYHVQHVMNYTDVDDKTIRRSKETYPDATPQEALHLLTDQYIAAFLDDMNKVGNDTHAMQFVRATDKSSIAAMQELITALYKKGFAYVADDGAYFSIDAYRKSGKTYGQLLELSADNTSEARIHNDEYDKESVHDFALWKKQRDDEPAWPFTLGDHDLTGRPGWHIECSAMSRQALGQPFDIHTGGIDLIFPHHENEIAQSTALETDPLMARFFCHNDHILVDGKKMAKSANNFYTLADVVKKGYDPIAFRLLVLQSHYRNPVNFTWESLEAAQNRLQRWRATSELRWQVLSEDETAQQHTTKSAAILRAVSQALQDDLNTPIALSAIDQLMNLAETEGLTSSMLPSFTQLLQLMQRTLGIDLLSGDITDEQKQLITARQQARETKDWQQSDTLRDQLAEQGIAVRDTGHGPIWYRA